MTEVDVTGINPIAHPELASWEWPVALDLFIAGLVGGLMILTAVLRRRQDDAWARAVRIADLSALPLLAVGLSLLFLDLSYKLHAWRFFVAFEPTSAMSWGSWIIATSAVVLALRACVALTDTAWFTDQRGWSRSVVGAIASFWKPRARWLDVAGLVAGTALASYTGLLLSTIPARPLWDSALVVPLFLVTGLGAAAAFVGLFLSADAYRRLTPAAMTVGVAEIALVGAFLTSLAAGTAATRRAAASLLTGPYGPMFWVVLVAGLLIPLGIEAMEHRRFRVPRLVGRSVPLVKLAGRAGLRFVIVLAGLQTLV